MFESDSHPSPASAAVLLLCTDGRSLSKIFPQTNLCKPWRKESSPNPLSFIQREHHRGNSVTGRKTCVKCTCKSDSMPRRLLSRLRSIVSPFRSSLICSKMPSTVRFWTALSLTIWVRNSSNPVSLQGTQNINLRPPVNHSRRRI